MLTQLSLIKTKSLRFVYFSFTLLFTISTYDAFRAQDATTKAAAAIDAANGSAMLDQTLEVSFAFSKGPLNK